MKKISILSFFFIIFAFHSFAEPPDFTNRRPVLDSEIRHKVDTILKTGSYARTYAFVNFEVDRGFIYLQGHVESEADKNILEARLSQIKGVAGIKDDINVYQLRSRFDTQTNQTY